MVLSANLPAQYLVCRGVQHFMLVMPGLFLPQDLAHVQLEFTFSLPTTCSVDKTVLRSGNLLNSSEIRTGQSLGHGMALYGQTGNCKLTRIERQIDVWRPIILHRDIANINEV